MTVYVVTQECSSVLVIRQIFSLLISSARIYHVSNKKKKKEYID